MTLILQGKPVKEKVEKNIKNRVNQLLGRNIVPTIGLIRIGENPSDIAYEKGIKKNAEALEIKVESRLLHNEVSQEDIINAIKEFNNRDEIGGILIFKPLPKSIDENIINATIDPRKDVDCVHPLNQAKIFMGREDSFIPCTPLAAVKIMEEHNLKLEGKNILVINRSMIVGKPLAILLLNRNATVTLAHSKSENLEELCKSAHIICTATGKSEFLDRKYTTKDSVIIDIGVSMNSEGKMRGDCKFSDLENYVKAITPVPGGVGSITNMLMLSQSLDYYNII